MVGGIDVLPAALLCDLRVLRSRFLDGGRMWKLSMPVAPTSATFHALGVHRSAAGRSRAPSATAEEFQSVMQSIERWHRNANAEPIGLTRWVRQKPTHAYVAAGGWFLFCIAGFFPCPLWLAPLYAWCIFAGDSGDREPAAILAQASSLVKSRVHETRCQEQRPRLPSDRFGRRTLGSSLEESSGSGNRAVRRWGSAQSCAVPCARAP